MIELIQSIGIPVSVKKNEYLFRQGDMNNSLFWIRSGLFKAYYQTADGHEWVKSFLVEGNMIGSLQAVVANVCTSFSLVCLEDSEVLQISGKDFLRLLNHHPEHYPVLNQFLLNLAMKKEQREYELLCLSAEERYRRVLAREAELLKRLSQQEIAKYIGITPVGLSRIRKRLGMVN